MCGGGLKSGAVMGGGGRLVRERPRPPLVVVLIEGGAIEAAVGTAKGADDAAAQQR